LAEAEFPFKGKKGFKGKKPQVAFPWAPIYMRMESSNQGRVSPHPLADGASGNGTSGFQAHFAHERLETFETYFREMVFVPAILITAYIQRSKLSSVA
jgi:hypothetical protein